MTPETQKQVEEKLALIVRKGAPLLEWTAKESLATQEELNEAALAFNAVAKELERIEDQRTALSKPMNAALKQWNATAKAAAAPFEAVKTHLQTLIGDYKAELRAKQLKEAEKVAKRAEKRGELQFAADLRETAAMVEVKAPGVVVATTWKGRVTNVRELAMAVAQGKLPETLLAVSESVLNQLARVYKAEMGQHVPGAEAFEVDITRRQGSF